MDNSQIEKFNPTVVELNSLVKKSKNITASDLKDKAQIEVVKQQRIELKKARCAITNEGKRLREDSNAFLKKVLNREKELIAIVEPEELRLSAIEDEAKQIRIRERRMSELPEKRDKLATIGDSVVEFTDEDMVEMDDNAFIEYFNQRVADKNEADRIENERKAQEAEEKARKRREAEDAEIKAQQEKVRLEQEAKQKEIDANDLVIKEAQNKIDRDKEIAEAKETAREEAEQKAKDDADRREREEKERIEQENLERINAREVLAKEERYQKFLSDNGYNEETKSGFHLTDTPETVIVWKKMATFVK